MSTVYGGLYLRLKESLTPISDKLKLIRFAWKDDRVYLPNKEQVLLDCLCGYIVNKKKYALTDEDEADIWRCLSEILQSRRLLLAEAQSRHVFLKPSLAQCLIDAVEQSILSNQHLSAGDIIRTKNVIGCCQVIVTRQHLNRIFTTRLVNLICLTASVYRLTCTLLNNTEESLSHDALFLVDSVTSLCVKCIRGNASVKQNIHLIAEKLLLPGLFLRKLLLPGSHGDEPQINDLEANASHLNNSVPDEKSRLAGCIQELLCQILTHVDLEALYNKYLASATKLEDNISKALVTLFKLLNYDIAVNHTSLCNLRSFDKMMTYSFLPPFYEHFIGNCCKSNSNNEHLMFVHLCTLLGFKKPQSDLPLANNESKHLDDASNPSDADTNTVLERRDTLQASSLHVDSKGMQIILHELLALVQRHDLYNVARDTNVNKGKQLTIYRHLLTSLLEQYPHEAWFKCLNRFLALNHLILEPVLITVLDKAWLRFPTALSRDRVVKQQNLLLGNLLTTYNKLYQFPKLVDKILSALKVLNENVSSVNDSNTMMENICPAGFIKHVSELIQELPQTSTVDLLKRLITELIEVYLPSITSGIYSLSAFQVFVKLLCVYLLNMRMCDYTVTELMAAKVQDIMVTMEMDALKPLIELCLKRQHKDDVLLGLVLFLAYCWGEVTLLLGLHKFGDSMKLRFGTCSINSDFPANDLSCLHSYLSPDQCTTIFKMRIKNYLLTHVLDLLLCQKLKMLMFHDTQEHDQGHLLIRDLSKCLMPTTLLLSLEGNIKAIVKHEHWDGNVESISDQNVHIAKLALFRDNFSLLVPFASSEERAYIAGIIVQALIDGDTADYNSNLKHKCQSVTSVITQIISSPFLHEDRHILSAIVLEVWRTTLGRFPSTSLFASPRKKLRKRKSEASQTPASNTYHEIFRSLVYDNESSDGIQVLQKAMSLLADASHCNHIDADNMPSVQYFQKILKILETLPLGYLSQIEQCKCLCALITLLVYTTRYWNQLDHTSCKQIDSVQTSSKHKRKSRAADVTIINSNEMDQNNQSSVLRKSMQQIEVDQENIKEFTQQDKAGQTGLSHTFEPCQTDSTALLRACLRLCIIIMESRDGSLFLSLQPVDVLLEQLQSVVMVIQTQVADSVSQTSAQREMRTLLGLVVSQIIASEQSLSDMITYINQLSLSMHDLEGGTNSGLFMCAVLMQEFNKAISSRSLRVKNTVIVEQFKLLSMTIIDLLEPLCQSMASLPLMNCSVWDCLCAILNSIMTIMDSDNEPRIIRILTAVMDWFVTCCPSNKDMDAEVIISGLHVIEALCSLKTLTLKDILTQKQKYILWQDLVKMLTSCKMVSLGSRACSMIKQRDSHEEYAPEWLTKQVSQIFTHSNEPMGSDTHIAHLHSNEKADLDDKDAIIEQPMSIEEENLNSSIHVTLISLLKSLDVEHFHKAMNYLTECCDVRNLFWDTQAIVSSILAWTDILDIEIPAEVLPVFNTAVRETVNKCHMIMEQVSQYNCTENAELHTIILPLLTVETKILSCQNTKDLLTIDLHLMTMCIHACLCTPLDGRISQDAFVQNFHAIYEMLTAMLLNHTEAVYMSIAGYINCIKHLLKSLIHAGRQCGHLAGMADTMKDHVSCAYLMDRFFMQICSAHKAEFSKVAVYLVADYVTEVQKVTLFPTVKNALVPAIYKLLDLCDEYRITLLHTNLSRGVRGIFKQIHEDYLKYHKYKGKV